MKLLLLILLFCFLTAVFTVVIRLKTIANKKIKNDINKIITVMQRIRYGDISIKLDNLNDKELEKSINRLIETINDREMMIKEYQTTLSNKNISLEAIIKQEKQLQMFKEEFAATLTHDMKVPVIAELNSINYLLDGRFGTINEKQTEILKLMRNSNLELKDLIENMLETYKLEQKELVLDLKEHNFNNFIEEIIKEMTPIVISSEHIIETEMEETNNLTIPFDEMQLRRVIKNLIQNALSYSPNKSTIYIRTYISMDCVKFVISNHGGNISKEDLENIFKKYYSAYSKFKKSGTGLGLYLAQKIILAHNGNISIEPEKDGLTSFIMTLPIKN